MQLFSAQLQSDNQPTALLGFKRNSSIVQGLLL